MLILVPMRHLFFFLLSTLVLTACSSNQAPKVRLDRVWIHTSLQSRDLDLENERKYGGTTEYLFDNGNFIDLQPDGSFASYLTAFTSGKWTKEAGALVLTDPAGRKLELKIEELNEKELIVRNLRNNRIYRFDGYPNDFASPAENPFSAVNQQWRLHPDHNESDAEITTRLKDHFRFWECFYEWKSANGIKNIEASNITSVLELYGNGFKVRYWSDQYPDWKNNFYDTTDCWRAYEKVHYFVASGKVKFPKTKNYDEGFVQVFRKMQEGMGGESKE